MEPSEPPPGCLLIRPFRPTPQKVLGSWAPQRTDWPRALATKALGRCPHTRKDPLKFILLKTQVFFPRARTRWGEPLIELKFSMLFTPPSTGRRVPLKRVTQSTQIALVVHKCKERRSELGEVPLSSNPLRGAGCQRASTDRSGARRHLPGRRHSLLGAEQLRS